jgi:hypothetical protein
VSTPAIHDVLRSALAEWATWPTFLGAEQEPHPRDGAKARWIVRFAGEEKDVIAVWLSIHQRTLAVEVELMPAPEANELEIFRYLLTKNVQLAPLHAALGSEDGLYLVGHFGLDTVTSATVDEVCGAAVRYVDELFPTVMAWGYPGLYRRRRRH